MIRMVVVVLLVAGIRGQCAAETTCEGCVANPMCGYCLSSSSVSGCAPMNNETRLPVNASICSGSEDLWRVDACPDPCNAFGSCADCFTAFPIGCGYCWSTGICMKAEVNSTCPDLRQSGVSEVRACAANVPCNENIMCSSCTNNVWNTCRWCDGVGKNKVGACIAGAVLEDNCVLQEKNCKEKSGAGKVMWALRAFLE